MWDREEEDPVGQHGRHGAHMGFYLNLSPFLPITINDIVLLPT